MSTFIPEEEEIVHLFLGLSLFYSQLFSPLSSTRVPLFLILSFFHISSCILIVVLFLFRLLSLNRLPPYLSSDKGYSSLSPSRLSNRGHVCRPSPSPSGPTSDAARRLLRVSGCVCVCVDVVYCWISHVTPLVWPRMALISHYQHKHTHTHTNQKYLIKMFLLRCYSRLSDSFLSFPAPLACMSITFLLCIIPPQTSLFLLDPSFPLATFVLSIQLKCPDYLLHCFFSSFFYLLPACFLL